MGQEKCMRDGKMRKWMYAILAVFLMISSVACGREDDTPAADGTTASKMDGAGDIGVKEDLAMKIRVEANGSTFTSTLEDNDAAVTFAEMMEEDPVVIGMNDYAGFEKVGSLGTNLPENNSQMTTQAGDIVLYNGNQIVVFYGSNSWSYTKLATIDDLSGWVDALGSGSVTVTFSIE